MILIIHKHLCLIIMTKYYFKHRQQCIRGEISKQVRVVIMRYVCLAMCVWFMLLYVVNLLINVG